MYPCKSLLFMIYFSLAHRSELLIAVVDDHSELYNSAKVNDHSELYNSAKVNDHSELYNSAKVNDHSEQYNSAKVNDHSELYNSAKVNNCSTRSLIISCFSICCWSIFITDIFRPLSLVFNMSSQCPPLSQHGPPYAGLLL